MDDLYMVGSIAPLKLRGGPVLDVTHPSGRGSSTIPSMGFRWGTGSEDQAAKALERDHGRASVS